MVSMLQDRRLQYLFLFKAGDLEKRRLDYWLSAALVEGLEDKSLGLLLKMCVEFVEFTKECPTCIEGFLKVYLKSWDGKEHRESIFELLVCLIPTDLEGIFISELKLILEYLREITAPLKEIFDKGDMGFFIALLRYYTCLFSRWANIFGKSFLVGSAPSPLYYSP